MQSFPMPDELTNLTGRIVVDDAIDDLIDRVASALMREALDGLAKRGVFHLALSGGSTPVRLFRRMVIDPRYRAMPWGHTHVWMVDERCVHEDDPASNWRMFREHLVDHVPIPAEQLHPMPAIAAGGDEAYEQDLRRHITVRDARGTPRLDHVMLGMGGDGHTASLFPNTGALVENDRLVVFNDGDTVAAPRPRMTMTYRPINAARSIAVLVTGSTKYAMLRRVAREAGPTPGLPITGVHPTHADAELVWYLDGEAVGDR